MSVTGSLSPALRMLSRMRPERTGPALLPNTIVIGAQKAGTTWIHRRLDEHPQAFMTRQKEVSFFLPGQSAETIKEYSARFKGSERALVRGESTPGYFWTPYPNTPARDAHFGFAADWVRKICGPEVRLILSLRDPVARAISAYYHHFRGGRFSASRSILNSGDRGSVIDIGRYSRHWAYWRERFDRSNFLIFTLEAVRRDPADACARLYEALGLDPMPNPQAATAENRGFSLSWDEDRLQPVAGPARAWNRRYESKVTSGEMPVVTRDEIEMLIKKYAGEYAFMNTLQTDNEYQPTVEAVVESLGAESGPMRMDVART